MKSKNNIKEPYNNKQSKKLLLKINFSKSFNNTKAQFNNLNNKYLIYKKK